MDIRFNGFNENVVTFLCDSTAAAGKVVRMKENGTVTACAAGENFIGVCLSVRDGYAAVQLSGYVELPVSGSGVSAGYCTLTAAESGAVKGAQAGREYLVLEKTTDTVGFIL